MRKKGIIFIIAILVFAAAIIPQKKVDAKAKRWYGKYWELRETAKKSIKIKGNKLTIKGKWANTTKEDGSAKEKKIKKKTFKLTKKTKYYFSDDFHEKAYKVSKKKFKKSLYSDVTYCSLKVKSGKVLIAKLSFN